MFREPRHDASMLDTGRHPEVLRRYALTVARVSLYDDMQPARMSFRNLSAASRPWASMPAWEASRVKVSEKASALAHSVSTDHP
jgi:hypothetical protein